MPPNLSPPRESRPLLPGLSIRATRLEDVDAITALANLPGYRAGTLRLPYQKPELARRWLESLGPEAFNLVAVLDGIIVGNAGLDRYSGRRSHAAGVGMGVHDDHRGKGIGTALLREITDAADQWLRIERLELTVFADNLQAIRLYERFGFEQEGILRNYAFRAGVLADAHLMARLRG
ncbi:GNAT family N-acetyltransferase [Labrys sedimenti]|uniref:GNAT family N-acetyltransferase n=1 Tax=Labrys sedimenti TaxID=3106036 RepID=UPI002ACA9D75|nr:GNAT family N-acetyltransferase [Labrys sp. ZIDIC5]MDZ5451836.1 GNAT family N-acetyltransferase [Labrys sp. ZIDIC5]